MSPKVYQLSEVRLKIEWYCAYQERCQSEVIKKLLSFGISMSTAEIILVELIQNNFVNEARFAEAYAQGKFRIKSWGKHKIKQKLKEKRVADKCINDALVSIEMDEYLSKIDQLIERKLIELQNSGKSDFEKKGRVSKYLYSKGFEWDLINQALF